jgi:hypothetical protein
MFKEKLLRKIERTMDSYMRDRYYWFDHLEIEFDPHGSKVLRQNEPLVTYIVYFRDGDYDFRETWKNGENNLDKGNDSQQSAQEYISMMHGSIFKFEEQRIYFTYYAILPNGDRTSFPFISSKMKKGINESTNKIEKYYNYVVNDIIKRLEFNDPIFNHMAELYGERINTCNLFSSIIEHVRNGYGARIDEAHKIVMLVKQRLDKMYPHRCDPDYRG